MMNDDVNNVNYVNNVNNIASKRSSRKLIEVPEELWGAFKFVAFSKGLKVSEAIQEAIVDYINKHSTLTREKLEIKIVENREAKENLLQVIAEEEIRDILRELVAAKQRKANPAYLEDLKHRLLDMLKKTPVVSSELAQEIKITLQNLRGSYGYS